jgi:heme/copper-type cytochrome/quinol oxidase subunit 3
MVDVSALPAHAFGHRSVLWWATLGMILIETTAFALAIAAYFYLKSRADHWPPGLQPPLLKWGVVNTIVLLSSCVPNQLAKNAAERYDLRGVRVWLVVCNAFAIAFIVVRVLEFTTLNCSFDTNAYGSIVWLTLGLHTTHLVTDFLDTAVLTVLMFVGPIEDRRFVDVSENAFYWYFVMLAWLPIFAVIYLAPRVL